MKNNLVTITTLAVFSLIAGYLISCISLVGRIGIGLFYHQYHFLKSWWKAALLVFVVWVAVLSIQSLLRKRLALRTFNITQALWILTITTGVCFSYTDFRHTVSHRWLGERFHLGVYLFWLGLAGITFGKWRQPKVYLTPDESNNLFLNVNGK